MSRDIAQKIKAAVEESERRSAEKLSNRNAKDGSDKEKPSDIGAIPWTMAKAITEGWDDERLSKELRSAQDSINVTRVPKQNEAGKIAQTAVSGATTGIRGAAERARNTYIPAQFGQRIVDRQKALEEAERLRNTYIPAQFGQRELENARKRSGTPERYDYLTGLDLKAAQVEYDDLSAYLEQDEQRYNRMKVKLASYGSNTKDSGAMAIQRFLSEYETKQARAAELERDIYGAKNIQRVAGYDRLTQSGMFGPMAEQGRKYSASGPFDAFAAKHAYINDTDGARAKADVNAMRAGTADPNAIYSLMEDDEIKVFNYLTAVRGKKAALEYLDALSEELNERQTEKTVGNIEGVEQTTAGKVFGSALSVALAAPKAAGFVGAAIDHASGKYVSEYSPHLRYSVAQQAMRAEASKDMGEVGSFLYNTGMSIADSTSVALMTGGTGVGQAASLGIMGLGASSDTTLEAIRRGASQEQAFQMGALAGIAEAAFEKFSVEGFWKAAQAGTRGAVLKNILRQSGIEASEEICTEITNIITDDLIMGGMSEYNAAVEAYMKQGMSREDAERKANTGLAAQIGLAGLGGALSGGVSGTLAGGIGQWRGKGANGEPSINGAIIGSGALKEDTATAPAAQATVKMNETTEQYAYTDPTTGIPMVGTRPAQDTQTGNAAADTAKPAVETEEYAYIDKTTGIPMVGERPVRRMNAAADEISTTLDGATKHGYAVQEGANGGADLRAQGKTIHLDAVEATAIAEAYEGGMDAVEYTMAFHTVYEQAKQGKELGQIRKKGTGRNFAKPDIKAAYSAGRLANQRAAVLDPNSGFKAGVTMLPDAQLSKEQETQLNVLDALCRKYGVSAIADDALYLDETGNARSDVNAAYNGNTNRIHINLNAIGDAYLAVGVHELTHYVRANNAAGYSTLENFVLDALRSEGEDVDALVRYQMDQFGYSEETAREEVVANTIPAILNDESYVKKLVEADRTLAERIRDFLQEFMDTIKETLRTLEGEASWKQMQSIRQDTELLSTIADLFDAALGETQKSSTLSETDRMKYSIDPGFETRYDEWALNGRPERTLRVGTTSDVIVKLGAKKQNVMMHSADIKHALRHDGITDNIIKQIPTLLEDPTAILKSTLVAPKNKQEASRIVAYGNVYDENGAPVLAVVELKPRAKGGQVLDVQLVKNAYGKNHGLAEQFEKSDVMYLNPDKNRTNSWLQGLGLQLPSDTTRYGSIGSILYDGNYVKLMGVPYAQIVQETVVGRDSSENVKLSVQDQDYNSESRKKRHKEAQFRIIQQSNPADDSYHTWIRNADEIKTFEETLSDPDWEGYDEFDPDYTLDMARNAAESGEITVYSSYPIQNGNFVTPSRMEAESYSGDGTVFEETVNLNDVAWIDPTQGQYAKVEQPGAPLPEYSPFDDLATSAEPPSSKTGNSSEKINLSAQDAEANAASEQEGARATELTGKRKAYKRRHERAFIENVAKALGIPGTAKGELRKMISELGDRVIATDQLSEADAKAMFEKCYEAAREYDNSMVEQYGPLKEYLRNKAIRSTDLTSEQRDAARGKLRMNGNGAPLVNVYDDLLAEFPGVFDDSLTSPEDQFAEILNKYDSIKTREYTLDEFHGENAAAVKMEARANFEEELFQLRRKLNLAERSETVAHARRQERLRTAAEAESIQTVEKALSEIKEKQKALDRVMRKLELTEGDRSLINAVFKGGITLGELQSRSNFDELKAYYDARAEVESRKKIVDEYNKKRRERLRNDAMNAIENSDRWKDKRMGLLYARETQERNIRDITGNEQDAERIIAGYIRPVHENETKRTRYINDMNERMLALKLNKWESKATQLIGEAVEYKERLAEIEKRGMNQDAEAKLIQKGLDLVGTEYAKLVEKHGKEIDRAKCEAALPTVREIYNQVFQDMNDALVRNGYPKVEYRRNYFPHFIGREYDSEGQKIAKAFGFNLTNMDLPTDIAGLTSAFRPGKTWFANALERMGVKTEFDLYGGFDSYIRGATDVIFHTDDIQRLRALDNAIRYKYSDEGIKSRMQELMDNEDLTPEERANQIGALYTNEKGKSMRTQLSAYASNLTEYTNLLANKKSLRDRGTEEDFGRTIYSLANWFQNRYAANAIAGNIGVALSNFIPITQATSEVGNVTLLRAMQDTITAIAKDDGFAAQSDFLTNRRGTDMLSKDWIMKASDKLSIPFEKVDRFASETLVRAKLAQNLKAGMNYEAAMENADAWAAGLMADRSKGALPTVFGRKNPLTRMFTMFQVEGNNQLSYIFKDVPRDMKEKGIAAIVGALFKMFLAAWMYNELDEQITGRRRALDPLHMIAEAVGVDWKTENVIPRIAGTKTAEEAPLFTYEPQPFVNAAENTYKNVVDQLPFFGSLLGGDGGRSPAAAAAPDMWRVTKTLFDDKTDADYKNDVVWNELKKPLFYILPPFAGGQVKKAIEGIQTVREGGSYKKDKGGNDLLRFRTDQTGFDYAQAALFGPWALPEGRENVAQGFPVLSKDHTAAYKNAIANGIDGAHFLVLLDRYKALEPIKDENGKTEKTKDQQFREILFRDSTLTAEQKELIDRDVTGASYTADYSSEAMLEASQLKGSHADNVKLFEEAGGTAEKYLEYYNLYSGLEPTKDINGETIPGSRQVALRNNIMNDDDMTPEQKRQLDEALTGGKTRDYTSWFTFKLGKTSGSAYKRGKAYVAAGISETNALLIEQWMDGRKYTKADLRKYLSKLKLTDSEIEAVLEARY